MTFLDVCPVCDGDGGWSDDSPEATPHGPHFGPGVTCRACHGTGRVESEDAPLTMEEALMLDAEILRAYQRHRANIWHDREPFAVTSAPLFPMLRRLALALRGPIFGFSLAVICIALWIASSPR